MTNRTPQIALLSLLFLLVACTAQHPHRTTPPPADPIASAPASLLRGQGLAYARRGDLVRAQQYLAAAKLKGFDPRIVVPELVKVCVAGSRLRAALLYAEPYLRRHPEDAGMSYVVGTIHIALGNIQRASEHLTGALRGNEIMVDAAFSLAVLAAKEGKIEEERDHLQHYLELRPNGRFSVRAKVMLAKVTLAQADPEGHETVETVPAELSTPGRPLKIENTHDL